MKSNFLFKLFIPICLLASVCANAQYQGYVYTWDQSNTPSVSINSKKLTDPFMGGLNTITASSADLNADGLLDLVNYDYVNDVVYTFINSGTPGNPIYKNTPYYAAQFPQIYGFLLMRDYNRDGIMDLFHRGFSGIEIRKGFIQSGTLKFTKYKEVWYPGSFGQVNAYVQPGDIPVIADLDADQDLDIAAYDIFGTRMIWYKNLQIENTLPTDSFVVTEATNCWGKFTQGYVRTVTLNAACKGKSNIMQLDDEDTYDVKMGSLEFATKPSNKTRHTGNSSEVIDLDSDGDLDMLSGNVSYNDVHQMTWQGNKFISQDTQYKIGNQMLYNAMWPVLQYVDYDVDGKKDIVMGPHLERTNTQYADGNKMYVIKNSGTTANPIFSISTGFGLFEEMLDVGFNSYPTFFDYDKDGYKDLFIGGDGETDSANGLKLSSGIWYLHNTSYTSGTRSFELITKDFLNLRSRKLNGAYPHFGDVTGDGVSDLLLGNNAGQIAVYKNNAGSQAIEPNLVLLSDSFANIKISDYAAPCVFDANFDGINDIIVGDIFGSLHLYQGINSGGALSYTAGTTSLGNVMVGGNDYAYGYAAPYVGRIDNVIQKQLIVGTGDGTIERFDSLQLGITANYKEIDSTYSYIKTPFRAVPTAADIDKDGYYDLMIGNKMGGILYYRQQLLFPASGQIDDDTIIGTPASVANNIKLVLCNVYPNPASNELHINHTFNAVMQLNIYNAYGALVIQEKYSDQKEIILPITFLANGMYSYRITSAGKVASGKFAVQKSN
jgi:hypothetical protein